MKLHFLIIISIFLIHSTSCSQSNLSIESIKVENYGCEFPHAVGDNAKLVGQVNDLIKDHFMIDNFNLEEADDLRWYDLHFEYEIKSGTLCIDYAGEYAGGPYPNYVDYHLIIDLTTGKELKKEEIPFASFITLEGYYEFLDEYWMTGVKVAFQEAMDCADGSEPYCSVYDINYGQTSEEVTISLTGDCYPHVIRACSPGYSAIIPMEELKPYLNDFGLMTLSKDQYAGMLLLDQYLYYEKHQSSIPNNVFVVGKIDNKYPFKMALHIDSLNNKVNGYYYYEKNKVKIKLQGTIQESVIYLTETHEQKTTGYFQFDLSSAYDEAGFYLDNSEYLSGIWLKPDKSIKYPIAFEEVIFTNQ